jgi:ribosomal protein L37AE/L43A
MDGIIWLFLAFLVVLVCLGAVAGVRRRSSEVDSPRHCSSCETPISLRRVSWFNSLLFLPVWQCPHCGNRSRSKKGMTEQPEQEISE